VLQPRSFNRLQLGPVVGHTDQESSRIWIQVFDQPEHYTLRVMGVGLFRFVSTEPPQQQEFGTAIAQISGLRSDHIYRYQIYRRDRFIPRARGQFRTMPDPGSMADILFNVISCNSLEEDGMWPRFEEYVKDSAPHFILMVGDQVYIDDDEPDVFKEHLRSSADIRREALAEKYRLNWSREPVQRVLANVPTYMIWDDHDIHDGFGSTPQNSETLLSLHPKGLQAFEVFDAFYRDCRDVYWHFQACHNPQPEDNVAVAPGNYFRGPPQGRRRAMPFVFRCGRLVVLVLDSRGERDVFREKYPILGSEQWQFINEVFANLDADVEALAVVTPTPIASMDPQGQTQKLMGRRTDDIELFKKGDLEGIINLKGSSDKGQLALAIVSSHLSRLKGEPQNLGNFQLGSIDEARDQWSHHLSQPEQIALIKGAGQARLSNRIPGNPRSLLFISGDIHVGGIFDIVSKKPDFKAPCIVSSGISKTLGDPTRRPVFGTVIDEDFEIAPGIRSSLRHVVNSFNFGIINVIPTGSGAKVLGTIAHEETSFAFGIDITDLL
jgi:hypothetical protein